VRYFDSRIVGLTGTTSQVAVAAKAFHIYYRRVRDQDGSEQIDHTATMFFMGPDGKYLTFIHPDASPQKMAQLMKMKMENTTNVTSRRE
jgi:protein SCO1/2